MFLLLEYKLYLTDPSPFWVSKLGIMADVKYEDYGIVTFPFYDENFPETLTEIDEDYVELPTLKFTDFGYPNIDIRGCPPPAWTLATEVYIYCCATTLCVVSVVYVFFFNIFYEEIICFFLSFLSRKELNLPPMHSRC